MNPNKHSRILHAIAVLLAIITGTASVAGCVASVICYCSGMYSNLTKQDILNLMYEQIQEHYEMTVMENLDNPDFDGLRDTNLTYNIYKEGSISDSISDSDDTDMEEPAAEAFDSYPDNNDSHLYSTGDQFIHYDGIIANFLSRNDIEPADENVLTSTSQVKNIVYNTSNGIFYYKTYNNEYFPVRTLAINSRWGQLLEGQSKTNANTLRYRLQKETDAYVCASMSYDSLDTENYLNWMMATFDGTKLYTTCIISENFDAENTDIKNQYHDYFITRDTVEPLNNNELYVITDKNFPATVEIKGENYNLFSSIPDITTEKKNEKYVISSEIASPLDATKHDLFAQCTEVIDTLYPYHSIILYGTLALTVLFVWLIAYCCHFTLYLKPKGEGEGDRPGLFARIPLLLYLILTASIFMACVMLFMEIAGFWINSADSVLNVYLTLLFIVVIIGLGTAISLILNICERIRTKTLLRSTVCHLLGTRFEKVFRPLRNAAQRWIEFILEHTSLFLRVAVVWVFLSITELLCIAETIDNIEAELFLFAIYKISEVCLVFFCVSQFSHIANAAQQLAKGSLNGKLDTSRLFGPFRRHAENLNQIDDGIQIAVQERLKSEHFKTELITNVTHDIKTPLTSIINYVDLLKFEGITPEEQKSHLEVLDRQSARLKKLIEDLIEASKASTGNLMVNFETCNLNILLTQTLGEFEDKLLSNQLELIIRTSAKPAEGNSGEPVQTAENTDVLIAADSRHLWRIFDNLMTNICKYAQPNTRVYIDLETDADEARIIFRNISRYRLDGDGEALLERFVRGDSSRSAEGNGLGLSIAKSLAELMKGHLSLSVDGDLFKITVIFPLYNRPEE